MEEKYIAHFPSMARMWPYTKNSISLHLTSLLLHNFLNKIPWRWVETLTAETEGHLASENYHLREQKNTELNVTRNFLMVDRYVEPV